MERPVPLKFGQPIPDERRQIDVVTQRRLASRYPQHVVDQPVQALRVLPDDAGQPALQRLLRILGHQLPGMADGGQRIADFVSDRCRQPPHGCQLELLRPLFDLADVF
jgi:hypothetical protein